MGLRRSTQPPVHSEADLLKHLHWTQPHNDPGRNRLPLTTSPTASFFARSVQSVERTRQGHHGVDLPSHTTSHIFTSVMALRSFGRLLGGPAVWMAGGPICRSMSAATSKGGAGFESGGFKTHALAGEVDRFIAALKANPGLADEVVRKGGDDVVRIMAIPVRRRMIADGADTDHDNAISANEFNAWLGLSPPYLTTLTPTPTLPRMQGIVMPTTPLVCVCLSLSRCCSTYGGTRVLEQRVNHRCCCWC
jgi:hypothetical protein